jgi:hypothetical protein
MSGLEVVGVVLGVIPLVISTLEQYAKVAETVNRVRRAAQEFRIVARKLQAERVIFRNALTNLLNECTAIGPRTLELLLISVSHDAWKEPDVEAALTKRLGESMKSYHEHVLSISTALHAFKQRLHLRDDGQVSSNPFMPETMTDRLQDSFQRYHHLQTSIRALSVCVTKIRV